MKTESGIPVVLNIFISTIVFLFEADSIRFN